MIALNVYLTILITTLTVNIDAELFANGVIAGLVLLTSKRYQAIMEYARDLVQLMNIRQT
ncbi:MAG TPA: hypothetical protein DCZ43_02795 [candidate division Zixibacteria bacterium]|nr:hypothetical protein [candidate division Zixibacteria bacterium]